MTKTGGQTLDTADLALSIDGERADSSINQDEWSSGEQKSLEYSSIDPDPSGEATVRVIHDSSGNAIFEETWDFS